MKVDIDDPFHFNFILDAGDTSFDQQQLREEGERLIRYFLTALTFPEEDLWVNLSPYEKDRVVPVEFGRTEMGRDLLAQDYLLKLAAAEFFNPRNDVGRLFWDKIYSAAGSGAPLAAGSVNLLNRVWIVPQKAVVYEDEQGVLILESRLRVMTEDDYSATEAAKVPRGEITDGQSTDSRATPFIRDLIVPALEAAVNFGEDFAPLRQIYSALILAKWYKQNLGGTTLTQVYADQRRTAGLAIVDEEVKDILYQRYLAAFEKGAVNFIQEYLDPLTGQVVPRKYFAGGIILETSLDKDSPPGPLPSLAPRGERVLLDTAMEADTSARVETNVGDLKDEIWEALRSDDILGKIKPYILGLAYDADDQGFVAQMEQTFRHNPIEVRVELRRHEGTVLKIGELTAVRNIASFLKYKYIRDRLLEDGRYKALHTIEEASNGLARIEVKWLTEQGDYKALTPMDSKQGMTVEGLYAVKPEKGFYNFVVGFLPSSTKESNLPVLLATKVDAIKETRKASSLALDELIQRGVSPEKMQIVLVPYLESAQVEQYDRRIREHASRDLSIADIFTGERREWIRYAESLIFLRKMINENIPCWGCDNAQYWHFQRNRDSLNQAAHALMLKITSHKEMQGLQAQQAKMARNDFDRLLRSAALVCFWHGGEWRFSQGQDYKRYMSSEVVILAWNNGGDLGGIDLDPRQFDLETQGFRPKPSSPVASSEGEDLFIRGLHPNILQISPVQSLQSIWR